jgi:hypothetical protein
MLLILLPFFLASDIGPKPLDYAGHPTPLADMKGIDVEMASEDVKLVLSKAKLDVDAVFHMVNHGGAAEFEEGFPVGPYKTMTRFSVTIDGKPVPFKLVDRNSADPRADRSQEATPDYFGKGAKPADYWYVWTASFAAGGKHTHQVKYSVSLEHQHFYKQTGYVLHTGAAWKNAIGKAVVTLTFGDGFTIGHLRGVSPAGRFEADRVVWTFENLEPTKEHDLAIRYSLNPWKDELARERKTAPLSWSGRRGLTAMLREAPAYHGRKTFTPEELKAYLDALADLIGELKVEDGKPVLPATDPEVIHGPAEIVSALGGLRRGRYYVLESNLPEIFGPLAGEAIQAAREHPTDARAKEVLVAYRKFLGHLLAGELQLDYRPMAENKKAAANPNVKIVGRDDPKDGKVVPMDRLTDVQRKAIEAKAGEADAVLGK